MLEQFYKNAMSVTQIIFEELVLQVLDRDAIQGGALVICVRHEALHASDMRHDMDHAYCRHT